MLYEQQINHFEQKTDKKRALAGLAIAKEVNKEKPVIKIPQGVSFETKKVSKGGQKATKKPKIIEEVKSGIPIKEVAKKYRISKQTISNYLKEAES